MNKAFKNHLHECDLCIVGGGLSGMCAGIAAARHGMSVVIMQDRALFGGNASSEIRMWVSGASGKDCRETGIIEEIMLENLYRNPERGYPIWDSILYEFVMNEKNITSILNCSCLDAEMESGEIKSVTGWQTTTQSFHTVKAKYFADCSGDSVLAPLTNAEFRLGRESRSEFNESIAPVNADKKTMGLTCLITAREVERKIKFIPPEWANKYTRADLEPYRIPDMNDPSENYWYMELGGEDDSIADTEILRDKLLRVAFGIWDYIKNSGDYDADYWSLDFVGFLPGKRESRRYVGDHILTQNEVRDLGRFEDTVAFGGWPMDDHNPAGIATKESPTIFHKAPAQYGIPYRCLYSKNIGNLFFAGRNISTTHTAMSSTRVMATCALLGQAIGTAASIAKKYATDPRGVYECHIDELKNTLMEDDSYLPGNKLSSSALTKRGKLSTSGMYAEKLINGHARPIGDEENAWVGKLGDYIELTFDSPEKISEIRLTLDSDLNRQTVGADGYVHRKATVANVSRNMPLVHLPKTLISDIRVEVLSENGEWKYAARISDNRRRVAYIRLNETSRAVRIIPEKSYGNEEVRIFTLDVR